MKKDRFVAFFDAIMAIIMTIAVLQFAIPEGAKWSDLTDLGYQILVYALSFFLLGLMWINIHSLWDRAEYISHAVIGINIVMLFFSSMIPFLVIYIGRYFQETVPQLLYGIDMLCITLCNRLSLEFLKRENPQLIENIKLLRRTASIDLTIKLIGIIVGIVLFPPAIMLSVFISLIILTVNYFLLKKKKS